MFTMCLGVSGSARCEREAEVYRGRRSGVEGATSVKEHGPSVKGQAQAHPCRKRGCWPPTEVPLLAAGYRYFGICHFVRTSEGLFALHCFDIYDEVMYCSF